jgi:hypothetical protein
MAQDSPETRDPDYAGAAAVRHKLGIGCLVVIGGPFFVIGLVLLYSGVLGGGESALWARLAMLIAGGLLTAGIAALMYRQIYSRKSIETTLRAKHQHAREPWMWREDWAKGEFWDFGPQRLILTWVPVAGFVLIAVVLLLSNRSGSLRESLRDLFGDTPFLFYLLLGGALIGLVWSLRRAQLQSARAKKFGRSRFLMTEIPAYLGGRLLGQVETTMQEIPEGGVLVRFENVSFGAVSFGAGRRTQSEGQIVNVHCSEEVSLASEKLRLGTVGVVVPIDLTIDKSGLPYGDYSQTKGDTNEGQQVRHRWRLIVTAIQNGVDYSAEFQPPVFDVGKDGLVKSDAPDIAV